MSELKINREKLKQLCEQNQIEYLGVFGSVARGEFRPGSDVDLLVRFKPSARIGLFRLSGIEKQFTSLLGQKVDLVPDGGISPYIEPYIRKDLVQIYG